MSKPTNDKKHLQRRVEESVKNAAAMKKVREKPLGRAVPLQKSVEKNSSPMPYGTRNGDVKKPTTPSGPTTRPPSNTKATSPWQRPKVTPASAVFGKNDSGSSRPSSGSPRRGSSGPVKDNPSVSNAPLLKPSQLKNRQRAVSSASNNKTPSPAVSGNSRSRSISSPSNKEVPKPSVSPSNKEVPKPSVKPSSNSPVAYKAKNSGVVLPKIEKTDSTMETKKEKPNEKKADEKLLVPPKRSRAHVMPVSSTMKSQKKGHDFADHELTEWVNWCDACGSMILSLFGKCVRCKKCMMICHSKCALSVSLTCEADEVRANQIDPSWYKTIVEETKNEETLKEYNTIQRVLPQGELKEKIDKFNKTVKSTQQMTLQEDGETFRGFIRVSMNLSRPVSVESGEKERSKVQRKDSFYVNKGAVKALYLSSGTTAGEVIGALLQKYEIKDNPLKFALFEKQVRDEGHIVLRKMMARERPLFLRLLWGDGNSQQHAFILQENETREIQWESFSLPELYTFLKILEKEQSDHVKCIKVKYDCKRQDIVNAMDYQKKKGAKK